MSTNWFPCRDIISGGASFLNFINSLMVKGAKFIVNLCLISIWRQSQSLILICDLRVKYLFLLIIHIWFSRHDCFGRLLPSLTLLSIFVPLLKLVEDYSRMALCQLTGMLVIVEISHQSTMFPIKLWFFGRRCLWRIIHDECLMDFVINTAGSFPPFNSSRPWPSKPDCFLMVVECAKCFAIILQWLCVWIFFFLLFDCFRKCLFIGRKF